MDQSPTALFDSYEQDLQQILGSVREKLDGEAKEGRGGTFLRVANARVKMYEQVHLGC